MNKLLIGINMNYSSRRLDELAKNILIGMELVNKRVDTLGGKKVKKELNEEEQLEAMRETRDFFANKENQRKLEILKKRIVDTTFLDKFNSMSDGMQVTSQDRINEMNMAVTYNPYSEKE